MWQGRRGDQGPGEQLAQGFRELVAELGGLATPPRAGGQCGGWGRGWLGGEDEHAYPCSVPVSLKQELCLRRRRAGKVAGCGGVVHTRPAPSATFSSYVHRIWGIWVICALQGLFVCTESLTQAFHPHVPQGSRGSGLWGFFKCGSPENKQSCPRLPGRLQAGLRVAHHMSARVL